VPTQENQDKKETEIVVLREEYTNAKERLSQQSQTFQNFANESQRILRITLVFAGLLLTAISAVGPEAARQMIDPSQCAISSSISLSCISNQHLAFTFAVTLLLGALAHMVGNEARGVATIGEIGDIDDVRTKNKYTEKSYLKNRLDTYRERIKRNDDTIYVIESILAVGKGFIAASSVSLVMIAYVVSIGPIPLWVMVLIALLLITTLSNIMNKFPEGYLKKETGRERNSLWEKLKLIYRNE